MIILNPVQVNDARLSTSNVPENDAAEWQSGTTYNIGDEVMRTAVGTHSVYRSLTDSNTGNVPEDDDEVTPVNWTRLRATNRWAMFSSQINDQTEFNDVIDVVIDPQKLYNGLSFFNLDAATIQIVMTDSQAGVVYDQTYTLIDPGDVNNWYAWYFDPINSARTLAVLDLPPFPNAELRLIISKPGSVVKCGLVSLGSQTQLGRSNFGSNVGIVDYSRKERDPFGEPVIVPRNFSKRVGYNVSVETNFVNSVQNQLSDLRTTPLTFIGAIDFPSTIVYGYYRDFTIVLQTAAVSVMTIEVEGLT